MTARKLPWYKRNPADWLGATRELTLEERGAYNDLLELMYLRDRPIPDDPRFIAGQLGISPRKWGVIRQALIDADKVILRGDYISNDRFERDRNQSEKFKEAAVTWGHLGGKKRAANAKRNNQGEFDLSGRYEDENGRNPPSSSKGSLGDEPLEGEVVDNDDQTHENQSLSPRVALDDLDDSFLDKNDGSDDFRDVFSDFSHDLSPLKKDENGSFPRPSSKPARASQSQEDRESNLNTLHGRGSGGRGADRPRKKAANAVQLPKRWEPPQPTADIAAMTGRWPEGMLEREQRRFMDHALDKGRTAKDWDAAFRNWLRKADDDWNRDQQRNAGRGQSGWRTVAARI